MSLSFSKNLIEQLASLGTNPNITVNILKAIDSCERNNIKATYKEIQEKLSGKVELSTKSLYDHLNGLTKAGILEADHKRPKSWKIKQNFLFLTDISTPQVRRTEPSSNSWGVEGRRKIVEKLISELKMNPEEAHRIAQRVEEYAKGLGLVGMKKISKTTIISLVVEALLEKSESKEDSRSEYFENMAFRYLPIGWSLSYLEQRLRTTFKGEHPIPLVNRIFCNINLRRMPDELLSNIRGKRIYFHGLAKIFEPLNINHDMRTFFQWGVRTPLHYSRPPRHFNSALACVCSVLALCQQEVGGSQNIDHFNLLLAPFAEELKDSDYERDLRNHIDAFVSETWRLYLTRPHDPVFSSITLEFENSPIEESNIIVEGEMKENEYSEYWENAKDIANTIIETISKKKEENDYPPIYPRVFLKVNVNTLEKDLDSQMLKALLSILKQSHPTSVPLYFVNMDSEMNKSHSHVSYSCEIQRITPNEAEDDQHKGVLTFASLNLPRIGKEASSVEKTFEKTLSYIEDLVKKILYFDLKKRAYLKSRLSNQNPPLPIPVQPLYILARTDPTDHNHKYFDVEHSSLHIGLVGLYDFFLEPNTSSKKNGETDYEEIVERIIEFLEQLKATIDNLSMEHGIPMYLSQTPSQSGAFYRFFDSKPLEYVNILPIIYDDFESQLKLENKIHSFMLGGSVSRIYLPREEFPRNVDELKDILKRAIKTNVPLFKIIPQEPAKQIKMR